MVWFSVWGRLCSRAVQQGVAAGRVMWHVQGTFAAAAAPSGSVPCPSSPGCCRCSAFLRWSWWPLRWIKCVLCPHAVAHLNILCRESGIRGRPQDDCLLGNQEVFLLPWHGPQLPLNVRGWGSHLGVEGTALLEGVLSPGRLAGVEVGPVQLLRQLLGQLPGFLGRSLRSTALYS